MSESKQNMTGPVDTWEEMEKCYGIKIERKAEEPSQEQTMETGPVEYIESSSYGGASCETADEKPIETWRGPSAREDIDGINPHEVKENLHILKPTVHEDLKIEKPDVKPDLKQDIVSIMDVSMAEEKRRQLCQRRRQELRKGMLWSVVLGRPKASFFR